MQGVESVEFDCKVATVTMKAGASLSKEAVTKAIEAHEGWGVKEFAVAPERQTVLLFQVTGTKAADHAALAKKLAADVKGAQEVTIDSSGSAVVVLGKDGELTEKSLGEALKAANPAWAAKDFETKKWPKSLATYVVTVPGMAGDAEVATVRDVLEGLDKVLLVQVFRDTKTAWIRLKEPCDKISGEAKTALEAKGLAATVALQEKKAK